MLLEVHKWGLCDVLGAHVPACVRTTLKFPVELFDSRVVKYIEQGCFLETGLDWRPDLL